MRYKVHPITGWRAEPNQSHQSVTTNEHGLRGPRDMLKVAHENKVLLLGGSFAWGWGATSDATAPGSLIQAELNEESTDPVSLINLSEAGFTSLQEVQSCLTAIDELNPSTIICVTGYNDVWVSTFGGYVDHPRNREIIAHFDWAITTGLVRPQSHLKRVAKTLLRGNKSVQRVGKDFYAFANPSREQVPMQLFRQKVDSLSAIAKHKKIKLVYVLQPLLDFKSNKSSYEDHYCKFMKQQDPEGFYAKSFSEFRIYLEEHIRAEANPYLGFIDSTDFYDDLPETIFIDNVHVTDHGNEIWSKRLVEELKKQ